MMNESLLESLLEKLVLKSCQLANAVNDGNIKKERKLEKEIKKIKEGIKDKVNEISRAYNQKDIR